MSATDIRAFDTPQRQGAPPLPGGNAAGADKEEVF
jgi:hypothetical protein